MKQLMLLAITFTSSSTW